MIRFLIKFLFLICIPLNLQAEEIGSVDTVFKLLGANHKIVIEAFDDPKIPGVTCHLSRSKTGGIKGSLGLAEDTSDASIACRQTGPITIKHNPNTRIGASTIRSGDKMQEKNFKDGEEVFTKQTSIIFKSMQVVRFFDEKRNVLVYLVYSDKIIDGSPKNSISTVPILKWP